MHAVKEQRPKLIVDVSITPDDVFSPPLESGRASSTARELFTSRAQLASTEFSDRSKRTTTPEVTLAMTKDVVASPRPEVVAMRLPVGSVARSR